MLYRYSATRFRICYLKDVRKSGFEEVAPKKTTFPTSDKDEISRVSLSRTKRIIKEICLCNSFTHFATLTVNSELCDRFSLQACQDKLKYIIQERIRRKNKDFAYIFITEKHKNGAFHFHGLVKGCENELYKNQNGFLSIKAFDELGFNSFLPIKIYDKNSYEKVCNYITKYITKDCIKNDNNQIYISSRGLKKAEKYEIEATNFTNWSFENDYCKIKDFDFSTNDYDEDYLIFSKIIEKKC